VGPAEIARVGSVEIDILITAPATTTVIRSSAISESFPNSVATATPTTCWSKPPITSSPKAQIAIVAGTDITNTAMATTFAKVGYPIAQHRIDLI
jgi:hypothetical protein